MNNPVVADRTAMLEQAMIHHRAGRLEEAESLYRQLLASDRGHALANYGVAVIHYSAGRKPEAAAHFAEALESDATFADAYLDLTTVLKELKQFDMAVKVLERGTQYCPGNSEITAALVQLRGSRLHDQAIELAGQGRTTEAVQALEQSIALVPGDIKAHENLGHLLRRLGQLNAAADSFRRALAIDPGRADANFHLGALLLDQQQFSEAERHFRKLLASKPNDPQMIDNLGAVLARQDRFEEATDCFLQSLRINASYTPAWVNLGDALRSQLRLNDAIIAYQRAIALDPHCVDVQFNQSLALLTLGNFAEAWPGYAWRWRLSPKPDPLPIESLWRGEPLSGRTILLQTEQGFGDTLQFIRYAELVKARGARVVVECLPPILSLLERTAGVDAVVAVGQTLPPFDSHVPLLDLPEMFGTTLESIPAPAVFALDPRSEDRWRAELGGEVTFRIGIAWQGNPANREDRFRSFAIEQFEPLARQPGVTLYSLQSGPGREQVARVAERWPIVDLGDRLGDFLNIAAIVRQLDLVITCDSAPAHLAGSLGIPTWVALTHAADWRWLLDRETSPWYPSVRLFRQRKRGDWSEVFQRMAEALACEL